MHQRRMERKALAGSAVDITDDYDEVDNNVYSFIETIIGWYINEYGVKKPIYRRILVTTIEFTGSEMIIEYTKTTD